MPERAPLDLLVRPDEQCIALTRDFRLIQRLRGHRYSVDDMLVAHLACAVHEAPRRALDLGCGIGSVLLMVAWANPLTELLGVEAQPEHVALARRNVLLNQCEDRATILSADLRDLSPPGRFDLVTATPPYFDPSAATVCKDPQRAWAHFELRGGIEDYARAARRALSPEGLFVTCAAAEPPGRDTAALEEAGLTVISRRAVIPRTHKEPFLTLLVASRTHTPAIDPGPPLVLRELDGSRTAEHIAIRGWSGL